MKEKKTVLVTWDYTAVSANAFLHALKIARSVDNTIRLVHIIKDGDESDVKAANEKLKKKTDELTKIYNVPIESVLLKGSIFSEISKYSADNNDVVEALNSLMETEGDPMVMQLPRTPGRKDSEYMHLFSGPVDVDAHVAQAASTSEVSERSSVSSLAQRVEALEAEVAELKRQLNS